jgi:hypothetical protein
MPDSNLNEAEIDLIVSALLSRREEIATEIQRCTAALSLATDDVSVQSEKHHCEARRDEVESLIRKLIGEHITFTW